MHDHYNQHTGRFKFTSGDVDFLDYGGKWHWSPREGEHHFIRLENQENCCGSDATETYWCELRIVILDDVQDSIADALHSTGADEFLEQIEIGACDPITAETRAQIIAEACEQYGVAAPVTSLAGGNWRKMFAECARDSQSIADDNARLDQGKVNAIGQTPREFMRGDMNRALCDGLAEGNPAAEILVSMGMLR